MFLLIVTSYIHWHYTKAFSAMYAIWFNFVWFVEYFFSITPLLKSLFSPWKRVVAHSSNKWDFEDLASAILANVMSRIIGAIVRLSVIVFGLFVEVFLFFSIIPLYILWACAPLLLFGFFGYGVVSLFTL